MATRVPMHLPRVSCSLLRNKRALPLSRGLHVWACMGGDASPGSGGDENGSLDRRAGVEWYSCGAR